ncbi:MAG TPA: hypothetical protein VGF79_14235 [Bacteroidia bacterium]
MRSRHTTPEIHEKGTRNPYFWVNLAVTFVCIGIAFYFILNFYLQEMPTYNSWLYSLIAIVIGVYFYSRVNKCNTLTLYPDRLLVHSTLGLYNYSIFKKNIQSWEEYEKEYEETRWEELILFHDNKKFIISSLYYEHYSDFKYSLTRNVKRGITGNFSFYGIRFGLIVIAIGLYITFIHIRPFIFKSPELTYLDFTTLVKAEVQNVDRSNGESDLRFTLVDYPKIVFYIDSRSIQSTNIENFITIINPGEKYYMDILNKDFITIENRMKNPTIMDRVFNLYEARVFGMRNQNAEIEVPFLQQLELENSRYDNKDIKFLLLGISVILLGLYLVKIKFGIERTE